MSDTEWSLKGELVLSCNCTTFCPCVLSLGLHPPTEGYCQTWAGVRIDEGHYGSLSLSGLRMGLIMEIPGLMSRGNWTVGLFMDDRASTEAATALEKIMTGQAGGTTKLLTILVGNYLGMQRVPISYDVEGDTRHFKIPKIIDGVVDPIPGHGEGNHTVIENSQYWIASQIIVAQSKVSKMRAFGRNWNFAGRSAELCPLDWSGPK